MDIGHRQFLIRGCALVPHFFLGKDSCHHTFDTDYLRSVSLHCQIRHFWPKKITRCSMSGARLSAEFLYYVTRRRTNSSKRTGWPGRTATDSQLRRTSAFTYRRKWSWNVSSSWRLQLLMISDNRSTLLHDMCLSLAQRFSTQGGHEAITRGQSYLSTYLHYVHVVLLRFLKFFSRYTRSIAFYPPMRNASM